MAGKPGRSGGARAGAGRKKAPTVRAPYDDPLAFLRAVWTGDIDAGIRLQVDAAKAALPYLHQRSPGKKERAKEAARGVARRFSAPAPPKLAIVRRNPKDAA